MRARPPLLPLALLAVAVGPARPRAAAAQTATPAGAPAAAPAARPAGWRVAVDAGGVDSALAFTAMAPGWHLVAGPGAVIYAPSGGTGGRFTVESETFLFSSAVGTGVGVALGIAPSARMPDHTAFVVGPDGRFRVTRRDPIGERALVPWTAHAAVARHPGGRANVRQRLAVRVAGDSVRFDVNGQTVAALPRALVQPEGAVGLRVEPASDVHVGSLVLDGQNLAPVAPAADARTGARPAAAPRPGAPR